jgi:hypothetical protein
MKHTGHADVTGEKNGVSEDFVENFEGQGPRSNQVKFFAVAANLGKM